VTLRLRPYPRYRDSGLPWLGRIPSHWSAKRAKYLFAEVDERSVTGTEEQLSVSHITGVTPRRQKNVTMFKAESYIGHKRCQPGDLVINTMWAWMAALGVAREHGIVSPSYGVYRPRDPDKLNSKFLDHLLRTETYRSEYVTRSTGIRSSRLRLYPDKFLEIPVLQPPLEEQRAIADVLDAMNRRINRLIRAKRRLIELLEEQQVIIHQAVTRGLDPGVPMKPSGVDWLGDMPAHWKVSRLKHLAHLSSGESITSSKIRENGRFPVYGGNGQRGFTDEFTHSGEYVLIGRQGALCGNINYANGKFWASEHAVVVTVRKDVSIPWLGELLRSMNLNQYSQSAAQPGLSVERIRDLRVPVPDLEEQLAIAGSIQGFGNRIRDESSRFRREAELLKEYRQRLIADVVTGKLDVRGVELPSSPEDDEEEELIDNLEIEGGDSTDEDD